MSVNFWHDDTRVGEDTERREIDALSHIENDGILSGLVRKDVIHFSRDLYFIFEVLHQLDEDYGDMDSHTLEKDIKRFKEMVDDWNMKYPNLKFKFKVDGIQCLLKVYFLASTPHQLIPVLGKMNRFLRIEVYENYENGLEAVYTDDDINSTVDENTLTLRPEDGMVRLIYSEEDMQDPKSPEFRLCAYYAVKDGVNHDVDIENTARSFSFEITPNKQKDGGYGWLNQ